MVNKRMKDDNMKSTTRLSFLKDIIVLLPLYPMAWHSAWKKVFNNHSLFKGLSHEQKQNLKPISVIV